VTAVLATVAGVALVGIVLRDAFDALFHVEGQGTLSRVLTRLMWRTVGRTGRAHRLLPLAGPVALVVVITSWAIFLIVGWALIYWPHVPEGFRFDPGVDADDPALLNALNVSIVTLTTLGFGDVTPVAPALRLIVPCEALIGFGLLSASIAWLVSIHPALARRRSLAYEISLLRAAEADGRLSFDGLAPDATERLLAELTSRLIAVERDLVHFPIVYYFSAADPRFSLPVAAPYLLELGTRGAAPERPEIVRLRAGLLLAAIRDFAVTTANRFHGAEASDTEDLLRAYARDHFAGER
jgi:hypothetical protein